MKKQAAWWWRLGLPCGIPIAFDAPNVATKLVLTRLCFSSRMEAQYVPTVLTAATFAKGLFSMRLSSRVKTLIMQLASPVGRVTSGLKSLCSPRRARVYIAWIAITNASQGAGDALSVKGLVGRSDPGRLRAVIEKQARWVCLYLVTTRRLLTCYSL